RKPEMKHRDITLSNSALADAAISLTELTAIAQGDGVADREGASIRVHRIEVCGSTNRDATDLYFVSPKMNNAPTYGDFLSVTGGFVNRDAFILWWKQITSTTGGNSTDAAYSFRFPMKIHYSGSSSTSGQRNRIWFVVKNDTGGAISFEYALRIWYTDT
ncbi:hypothetical protein, partial [Achromobacter pulmonis]|uniref:hypothetical protein n=1 Tax=Achromobacter pulmonis TaxID=1389932 RepID=UPI001C632925